MSIIDKILFDYNVLKDLDQIEFDAMTVEELNTRFNEFLKTDKRFVNTIEEGNRLFFYLFTVIFDLNLSHQDDEINLDSFYLVDILVLLYHYPKKNSIVGTNRYIFKTAKYDSINTSEEQFKRSLLNTIDMFRDIDVEKYKYIAITSACTICALYPHDGYGYYYLGLFCELAMEKKNNFWNKYICPFFFKPRKFDIHEFNELPFRISCRSRRNALEKVKYLWGFCLKYNVRLIDIHVDNDDSFKFACNTGNLPLAKYLWELSLKPSVGRIDLSKLDLNNSPDEVKEWLSIL